MPQPGILEQASNRENQIGKKGNDFLNQSADTQFPRPQGTPPSQAQGQRPAQPQGDGSSSEGKGLSFLSKPGEEAFPTSDQQGMSDSERSVAVKTDLNKKVHYLNPELGAMISDMLVSTVSVKPSHLALGATAGYKATQAYNELLGYIYNQEVPEAYKGGNTPEEMIAGTAAYFLSNFVFNKLGDSVIDKVGEVADSMFKHKRNGETIFGYNEDVGMTSKEVAKVFERNDQKMPLGATGNSFWQGANAFLANNPSTINIMRSYAQEIADELEKKTKKQLLKPSQGKDASDYISSAVEAFRANNEYFDDWNKKIDGFFDSTAKDVGKVSTTNLMNYVNVLKKEDEYSWSAMLEKGGKELNAVVSGVMQKIEEGADPSMIKINYKEFNNVRNIVEGQIKRLSGPHKHELTRVREAMLADLMEGAEKAGEETVATFNKARSEYRKLSNQKDELANIMKANEDTIQRTLDRELNRVSRVELARFKKNVQKINPQIWGDFVAGYLDRLLPKEGRGNPLMHFADNYPVLKEKGVIDLLFTEKDFPGLDAAYSDLSKMIKASSYEVKKLTGSQTYPLGIFERFLTLKSLAPSLASGGVTHLTTGSKVAGMMAAAGTGAAVMTAGFVVPRHIAKHIATNPEAIKAMAKGIKQEQSMAKKGVKFLLKGQRKLLKSWLSTMPEEYAIETARWLASTYDAEISQGMEDAGRQAAQMSHQNANERIGSSMGMQ